MNRMGQGNSKLAVAESGSFLSAPQHYGCAPYLTTAKTLRKWRENSGCTFTEHSNSAWMLIIRVIALLKRGVSRQEKASSCNRNGASSNAHIGDPVALEFGLDVNSAWAEHLD